jgi:hypothetical protein
MITGTEPTMSITAKSTMLAVIISLKLKWNSMCFGFVDDCGAYCKCYGDKTLLFAQQI